VNDLRRLEAKGLARAKARSRRLRVSRIRSLTFRGSLALFLLLWAVVFVQLASGNDPALSGKQKNGARGQQATPAARESQESREPAPEFEPEEVEPEEVEPEYEEPEYEYEYEPEVEYEEAEREPVVTASS
jgi:hypothetical protein